MLTESMLILCGVSVIASGLVAGVFLTFSDFVMKSLAAAEPAAGIEAMQIINRKVFRTVFMVLLLGMSALSLVLAGYAYVSASGPGANWAIAGGGLYFVGVFIVTLVGNVPMNTRLEGMDYKSVEVASYWRTYVPVWSRWNSVRTVASAAAAVCFLIACIQSAGRVAVYTTLQGAL